MSSSWRSSLAVSQELLDAQLGHLARRGYAGLTLAEAERRRTAGTLPARSLVVTFDDGYASTLLARPVLARYGFPGTVFVVTSFVESGEPMRWPGVEHWSDGPARPEMAPLSWAELESLRDDGWEVGSHTVTHPRLPGLDDGALQRELTDSRETIARRLGACETLAYPYGLADARVAAAAQAAGYLAAATLTTAHSADEPLLRPRVGLYPTDTGWRMRAKLAGAAGWARRTQVASTADRMRTALGRVGRHGYRESG